MIAMESSNNTGDDLKYNDDFNENDDMQISNEALLVDN